MMRTMTLVKLLTCSRERVRRLRPRISLSSLKTINNANMTIRGPLVNVIERLLPSCHAFRVMLNEPKLPEITINTYMARTVKNPSLAPSLWKWSGKRTPRGITLGTISRAKTGPRFELLAQPSSREIPIDRRKRSITSYT